MSYVKTPLMGLGQTTAGSIPDPWTQQKAAEFNAAVSATSGLGQEPPALKPINWGLVIGWGAVLFVAGSIFFGTATGTTMAHRNGRRARRNARRFVFDIYDDRGTHLGSTTAVSASDALRDFLDLTDEDLSAHWGTPYGDGAAEWVFEEHATRRPYTVVKRQGKRAIARRNGRRARRNSSLWSGARVDADIFFDAQSGEWMLMTRAHRGGGWTNRGFFTTWKAADHALANLRKQATRNDRWDDLAGLAQSSQAGIESAARRREEKAHQWRLEQAGVRTKRNTRRRRR